MKDKPQHTPGPWKAQGKRILDNSNGLLPIAEAFEPFWRRGDQPAQHPLHVAQANARLIAAAPELLEALQTLWTAQSRLNGSLPTWFNEAAEQARQAILKATGKL